MEANVNDGSQGQITTKMLEELRGTRPWTLFMAILGFIGVGFMVLGGLIMMAVGSFMPSPAQFPGTWMFVLMGFLYIAMAALYFFPALYLLRYSSSLGRFLEGRVSLDAETAFSYHRRFWKFLGIGTIAAFVFMILMMIATAIIPLLFMGSSSF